MATAGTTAQQSHQIEPLANDSLVGIKSMIRNDNESSIGSHRTILDACPKTAEQRIDLLQSGQVRLSIVVMVRCVIEIHGQQVEIADSFIAKSSNQLTLQLIKYYVAVVETGNKLRGQLNGFAAQELFLCRELQSLNPRAPAVKLLTEQTLIIVIAVGQNWHANRIQHFCARHVDVSPGGLLNEKGQEVQVVIGVQDIA